MLYDVAVDSMIAVSVVPQSSIAEHNTLIESLRPKRLIYKFVIDIYKISNLAVQGIAPMISLYL